MIVNNFGAMQAALELAENGRPLTSDDVLDLHRIVTSETLDDEADAGRIQRSGEDRVQIEWDTPVWDGRTVLHQPPAAAELPQRLEDLCRFANDEIGEGFTHPVLRAIVLHFWIAYDHPFVDGNGRVARALFYWAMLRHGYWLPNTFPISSILRKAPAKRCSPTEVRPTITTYLLPTLTVWRVYACHPKPQEYLARKTAEIRNVEALLHGSALLNHRQLVAVSNALRDAQQTFTIKGHAHFHQVTIQSARTDLLTLEGLGLYSKRKVGKRFVFTPAPDLTGRLRALAESTA